MIKQDVIRRIENEKLIVIVRGVDRRDLIPFADAMYNGGIRLLEITYDASGSIPDSETADRIRMLTEYFGERMMIGAGTVLTPAQVDLTKQAGGSFIISPDTAPDVISRTAALGLVSMPGAFTPTEVQTAHKAGADFVKLFPVSEIGTGYIKAIRAPLSHIKLIAVGGITPDNIPDYLRAGVCGFGIGSALTDRKAITENRFDLLTERAKAFCRATGKSN